MRQIENPSCAAKKEIGKNGILQLPVDQLLDISKFECFAASLLGETRRRIDVAKLIELLESCNTRLCFAIISQTRVTSRRDRYRAW